MRESKEAAPMLQQRDGGSGQLSFGEVRLPENHSITRSPGAQGLAALLRCGPENAVTVGRIAELWGCDPRQVTQALYNARRLGSPICSDTRGLYLPRDETDVRLCVRSMRHRAREIARSAAALGRAWVKRQEESNGKK